MQEIRSNTRDFFKKKKYLCMSCKKHYKYDKMQFVEKGGKCEKCGGELFDMDIRKY